MRRGLYGFIALVAIVLLLYAVRVPILRCFSNFLIRADAPEKSEVIFVLSGNAYDRGTHALKLYRNGLAPLVICTGGNPDGNMLALGRNYFECDLTRAALLTNGVDSNVVKTLPHGTSTMEEAEAILDYCKTNHVRSCIVITSLLHTRRVSWVLEKKLEREGITTYIAGAPSRFYDVTTWWESEYGLIDVNNEYMKLVYYVFKKVEN